MSIEVGIQNSRNIANKQELKAFSYNKLGFANKFRVNDMNLADTNSVHDNT